MNASKSLCLTTMFGSALLCSTGCDSGAGHQAGQLELGESLFFEKALSEKGNTACASCHRPESSFADRQRGSVGQNGKPGRRNAPVLFNRPAVGFEFWDGRALSLIDQVAHPLADPDEMGSSMEDACRRIERIPKYRTMFAQAFGTARITPELVATAIATYVASLQSYQSDYDRGRRTGSLLPRVLRGEKLFQGRARCVLCHVGPNFTDERFHNTGVSWKSSRDPGRGEWTGLQQEMRAFKTPTLRELTRTAPYMHDGSFASLDQVIDHYVGGGAPQDPRLDPVVRPIRLTLGERRDLIEFLGSLSDSRRPPFQTPSLAGQ